MWAGRLADGAAPGHSNRGGRARGGAGRGREEKEEKKKGGRAGGPHATRPVPSTSTPHTSPPQVSVSYASLLAGPTPLPATAPPSSFSEARAAVHVAALAAGDGKGGGDSAAGSGGRQVGTPGAAAAALYLHAAGNALGAAADAAGGHYAVETVTQHVSGSVDMRFLGIDFANTWHAIPNVAIKITPSRPSTDGQFSSDNASLHVSVPALLLGAHYDSTVGSPGASDAAACVAVALEAARALVSRPPPPPAAAPAPPLPSLAGRRRAAVRAARAAAPHGPASPVILLLNGAEEALMQGAFGFMRASPWAAEVGAFINLEATGADGPAAVFQASGSWATAAYAAGAPHPRGTVIAQAFFDAGLTPADTDFRVFAARADGHLPGIDAALILGAEVYHTHADAPGRLRPGTLQAFGEQATGGAAGLSAALAAGAAMMEGGGAGEGGLEVVLGAPGDLGPYFDVQGRFLVTYSPRTAAVLHTVPLVLVVALLALVPAFRGGAGPVALAASAGRAGAGVAAGVALPGLLGAALAAATRRPLAWFPAPGLLGLPAYAAFSLAGSLAPHVLGGGGGGGGGAAGTTPRAATAGFALIHAAAAAAGAAAGAPAAYLPALWALAATAACALPALTPLPEALAAVLAWAGAALVTTPNALTLGLHMLQKASFAGSPLIAAGPAAAAAVGDGLVAAAAGGCAAAVTGFGAGWVARRAGRRAGRTLAAGLILGGTALLLSAALYHGHAPYSPLHPKKLYLQKLHRLNGTDGVASEWVVAGVDATPLARALEAAALTSPPTLPPGLAAPFAPAPAAGRGLDWLVMYPLGYVMETAAAPAVRERGLGAADGPALAMVEEAGVGGTATTTRLALTLTLPPAAPAGTFGALNISAPGLTAWSFTPRNFSASPTDRAGGPGGPEEVAWHIVRIAGTPPDRRLPFWLEVASSSPRRPSVRLGVALAAVGAGAGGDAIVASLPPWVSVAVAETWVGEWVV